jgi:hypothetical protein
MSPLFLTHLSLHTRYATGPTSRLDITKSALVCGFTSDQHLAGHNSRKEVEFEIVIVVIAVVVLVVVALLVVVP